MQNKIRTLVLWMLFFLVLITIIVLVYGIIFPNNTQDWVGTNAYFDQTGNVVSPPKTLWDVFALLIIPVVLTIGAFLLNSSQRQIEIDRAERNKKLERELASDRNQEKTLYTYINKISDFILEKQLLDTEIDSSIQTIARTYTRVVVRGLNGTRKGNVLRFLEGTGLIDIKNTIILLTGADFRDANLKNASLMGLNLVRVNLSRAELTRSNLSETNLVRANLTSAKICSSVLKKTNLNRAILHKADLSEANLTGAELIRADLSESNLSMAVLNLTKLNGADFRGADLRGAKLKQTNLTGAKLEGVLYDLDTMWPPEFDLQNSGVKLFK